jgi:hypothetical protein
MYCDLQLIHASLGWYLNCLDEDIIYQLSYNSMLCVPRSVVVTEAIDNKYISTMNRFVIILCKGGNHE